MPYMHQGLVLSVTAQSQSPTQPRTPGEGEESGGCHKTHLSVTDMDATEAVLGSALAHTVMRFACCSHPTQHSVHSVPAVQRAT